MLADKFRQGRGRPEQRADRHSAIGKTCHILVSILFPTSLVFSTDPLFKHVLFQLALLQSYSVCRSHATVHGCDDGVAVTMMLRCCSVVWIPRRSGPTVVEVKVCGEHVPGSPFKVAMPACRQPHALDHSTNLAPVVIGSRKAFLSSMCAVIPSPLCPVMLVPMSCDCLLCSRPASPAQASGCTQ